MSFHVVFTPDGIPGWIGFEPRDGSEELPETRLDGEAEVPIDIDFLAAHMRLPSGEWVLRPPPPPLTEVELAEIAEVQAQAQAQGEADMLRRNEEEIARRAQPDVLLRAMGKITIAQLNARVEAIRLDVEAGN